MQKFKQSYLGTSSCSNSIVYSVVRRCGRQHCTTTAATAVLDWSARSDSNTLNDALNESTSFRSQQYQKHHQ